MNLKKKKNGDLKRKIINFKRVGYFLQYKHCIETISDLPKCMYTCYQSLGFIFIIH